MKKFPLIALWILFIVGCTSNPPVFTAPHTPPTPKPLKDINVALVLGGGGSRGLAHAGVLEVLEKNHIPIDLIVGSSAGSLIGALYADDPNAIRLKSKIIRLKRSDLIDLSLATSFKMLWQINGPVAGHSLQQFIQKNILSKNFETLKIPLIIVTTDAHTGETYPLRSGPLYPALAASSALPLVFKPISLYGKVLVDGGVSSPVPIDIAKAFNPKIIIAVDIGTSPDYGPIHNSYELGYRALHISYYHLSRWQAKEADVLIHPAIDQYPLFEDKFNAQIYQAGKLAAENVCR